MSNTRFIEIYSEHRDRNKYPKTSQFIVPLEQAGIRNTSTSALDPVIEAMPQYTFKLNTASTYTTAPFSPIRDFPSVPPGATKPTFQIYSSKDTPTLDPTSSYENNFYNGYHIVYLNNLAGFLIPECRLITGYDGNLQQCTLDFPFSSDPIYTSGGTVFGAEYILIDPSIPFLQIVNGLPGSVFGTANTIFLDFNGASLINPLLNFPTNGFPAGYFKGYWLQIIDVTTGLIVQERLISEFEQLAAGSNIYFLYVDNNFSINWTNILANPNNYRFRITIGLTDYQYTQLTQQTPPQPYIHLQPFDIFALNKPQIIDQFYTGYLIYNELTGESRKIINYNGTTKIATLESGFTYSTLFNPTNATVPPYANALFSIRQSIPLSIGTFPLTSLAGTTNIIYLDPTTSPKRDNYWNGKYIYIRPFNYGYNDVPSARNIYKITKYVGTTTPPYAYVNKTLEVSAIAGNKYEILNFSFDNFNPMCYTGSTVSQNNLVCYEVSLISLTLPNINLKSGNKIAFYPFIYVEFGNYNSASNKSKCIMYSNNPNSMNALFVCPNPDVSNPTTQPFVKFDGSAITQTVKFKPNDTLLFSVFLPNGELFEPILEDNKSPLPPNKLVQIEAIFSIKRLNTS